MTISQQRRRQRQAQQARRELLERRAAIDRHDGTTNMAAAFRAAHRVQPGGRK